MTEHPHAPQPTTDTAPGAAPAELSADFAGRVNAALETFLVEKAVEESQKLSLTVKVDVSQTPKLNEL